MASGRNKSPLFSRHVQGGAYVFTDETATTGDIFFVDSGSSTNGATAGYGDNPDKPLSTLDAAINRCTANNGDRIYVMPGHAEDLATNTTVNLDLAGVEVIGIGTGNDIPAFSATAAAGNFAITAASITLRNLKFIAEFTGGCTAALALSAAADYCTIDGCKFIDTLNTQEWKIHVTVATTVTDLHIKNCEFTHIAGGDGTNSLWFADASSNCIIENNLFNVDCSDDVIDHATGDSLNMTIRHNQIYNMDPTVAGYCVRYKSTGTGICHNNILAYNKNDAEIITGAAAWFFENYASNTVGESGVLDPANSAGIP